MLLQARPADQTLCAIIDHCLQAASVMHRGTYITSITFMVRLELEAHTLGTGTTNKVVVSIVPLALILVAQAAGTEEALQLDCCFMLQLSACLCTRKYESVFSLDGDHKL